MAYEPKYYTVCLNSSFIVTFLLSYPMHALLMCTYLHFKWAELHFHSWWSLIFTE